MELLEKDRNELLTNLRQHVTYPATKVQIIGSFKSMAQLPKSAIDWSEKAIPDRTYQNAEEVIRAAGLEPAKQPA